MFIFILLHIFLYKTNAQTITQYMDSKIEKECTNITAVYNTISSITPYNKKNGYKLAIIGCIIYDNKIVSSFFANDEFYSVTYPIKKNTEKTIVNNFLEYSNKDWIPIQKFNKTNVSFRNFTNAIIAMTNFTKYDEIIPIKYSDYEEYPEINLDKKHSKPILSLRFLQFYANNNLFILMYPLSESLEIISVKLAEYK